MYLEFPSAVHRIMANGERDAKNVKWLDSDEETLLVDKLYYQDKEFQKKEKKYNQTVIVENPLPILPVPERTTVSARDLLQDWPYLPGEDEIPSARELLGLGVILEGYSIFARESQRAWERIPVNIRALQEQALRSQSRKRRSDKITTVWDTYSKLPFHQQSAIMLLLSTIHNFDRGSRPYSTFPDPEGPILLNLDVKKHRRERFLDRLRSVTPFYGHGAPRATLFVVVARARDARDRFGPLDEPSPYGLPPVHPSRPGPVPPPPDPYWPGYGSGPAAPVIIHRPDRGYDRETWNPRRRRFSPARGLSPFTRGRYYADQNRHRQSWNRRDSYSEDRRPPPPEPYSFYPSRRVASPDVIDVPLPDRRYHREQPRRAKSRHGRDGSSDSYVERRQQRRSFPLKRRETTETVYFDDGTTRTQDTFPRREFNELVLRSPDSDQPRRPIYHSRTSTYNHDHQITPYPALYPSSRSSTRRRPWGTIRPSGAVTIYRPPPTGEYNGYGHRERPIRRATYKEDSDDSEDARPPTEGEKIEVANWYLRMWTTVLDKVKERVKHRYCSSGSSDDSYGGGHRRRGYRGDRRGRDRSRERPRRRNRCSSSADDDWVDLTDRRDVSGHEFVRDSAREARELERERDAIRERQELERLRDSVRERRELDRARNSMREQQELDRARQAVEERLRNNAVRTSQATTVGQNASTTPVWEITTADTATATGSAPLHATVEDATDRNGNGNGNGDGDGGDHGGRNGNEDAADSWVTRDDEIVD